MKDFRKSVIHLFVMTFFLLFIAWIGVKAMQYRGNYGRIIQDARRFLRENDAATLVRDKVMPFFREKLISVIERVSSAVKAWFE